MTTKILRNGYGISRLDPKACIDKATNLNARSSLSAVAESRRNGVLAGDIITSGLVLHLPLWMLKGSSIVSRDINSHTCSVTGALWSPQGRYFDGVNDFVGLPASASLDVAGTDQAFTFEVWVYFADYSPDTYSIPLGQSDLFIGRKKANEKGTFSIYHAAGDSIYLESNQSLSNEQWYHLTGTRDTSADCRIYVNGSLDCTPINYAKDPTGGERPKYLGSEGGTDYRTKGYIGEARVYSLALTPQEVQHNYLATKWRYR